MGAKRYLMVPQGGVRRVRCGSLLLLRTSGAAPSGDYVPVTVTHEKNRARVPRRSRFDRNAENECSARGVGEFVTESQIQGPRSQVGE